MGNHRRFWMVKVKVKNQTDQWVWTHRQRFVPGITVPGNLRSLLLPGSISSLWFLSSRPLDTFWQRWRHTLSCLVSQRIGTVQSVNRKQKNSKSLMEGNIRPLKPLEQLSAIVISPMFTNLTTSGDLGSWGHQGWLARGGISRFPSNDPWNCPVAGCYHQNWRVLGCVW